MHNASLSYEQNFLLYFCPSYHAAIPDPKTEQLIVSPPFFSQEKFNTQWAILQMNRSQIKRGTDKKKNWKGKQALSA